MSPPSRGASAHCRRCVRRGCWECADGGAPNWSFWRLPGLLFAGSGVEAYVLNADGLLTVASGDGVPDGHLVGGRCNS